MNQLGARRRQFLAGVAGASGAALWAHTAETKPHAAETKPHAADIPPTEDLMREHGILRRVLLVYEEGARRLSAGDATVLDVVAGAANIIRRFVEGYHEKLEEDFVFPRLEKAGKLVDLTTVLRVQHGAGRKLTDAILDGARAGKAAGADRRRTMVADIDSFIRMYARTRRGKTPSSSRSTAASSASASSTSSAIGSRSRSTSCSARAGSRGR